MILYGWGTKLKNIQFIGKFFCQQCGTFTNYYVAKEVFRITLFFIPVFWWTKKYYILCDNCHMGRELDKINATRIMEEKRNMYSEIKLDILMKDIIQRIHQNPTINAELLLEQIKKESQLPFEESYLQGFMEELCQVYGVSSVEENEQIKEKVLL